MDSLLPKVKTVRVMLQEMGEQQNAVFRMAFKMHNTTNYEIIDQNSANQPDMVLVDIDEQDDDLLVVLDLGGITLEYISTSNGLELEDAYLMDGGYCHIPLAEFHNDSLKNYVETLVMVGLKCEELR